jgi:2-methylcitrate dehydratase
VQKIEVTANADLNAKYPEGIPNRVRIQLRNGRFLEKEVTFPRGHAHNPMTDLEVETKFRLLAEPLLSEARIQEILDRCWNLDKQMDIGELLGLFEVS